MQQLHACLMGLGLVGMEEMLGCPAAACSVDGRLMAGYLLAGCSLSGYLTTAFSTAAYPY
jgi:hypothetical protein